MKNIVPEQKPVMTVDRALIRAGLTAFGLFICGVLMYWAFTRDVERNEKINLLTDQRDSLQKVNQSLQWDVRCYTEVHIKSIAYWMIFYEIKHPDVVMAQMMLESDFLESRLAVQNNNFIGMKRPGSRETTAAYFIPAPDGGEYCGYRTFIDCIEDIQLYQDQNYKGGNYMDYLARNSFSSDPDKMIKLKAMMYTLYHSEKEASTPDEAISRIQSLFI